MWIPLPYWTKYNKTLEVHPERWTFLQAPCWCCSKLTSESHCSLQREAKGWGYKSWKLTAAGVKTQSSQEPGHTSLIFSAVNTGVTPSLAAGSLHQNTTDIWGWFINICGRSSLVLYSALATHTASTHSMPSCDYQKCFQTWLTISEAAELEMWVITPVEDLLKYYWT